MDRSFLSQQSVIEASRQFVCIRLATYEDKTEGDFLKSFRVTRSGDLENTVFAVLSPDGKHQLARASRGAQQTFGDATRMAEAMNRIARQYGAKRLVDVHLPPLPQVANVRLAIDVAACDNQPLVVIFASDAKARKQLEEEITALAWSEQFLGRFVYVKASDAKELAKIDDVKTEQGVFVVQPDRFGLKAKVLKQVDATAPRDALVKCLEDSLVLHQRLEKSFSNHVRAGHEQGVYWETVLPVTDPLERQARERGRMRRNDPK